jgi:predicted nicotinamide N-methyase
VTVADVDADAREAFVREHTAVESPPMVPEVRLRLASALTPMWTTTQDWLDARGVEPPYWAFAWAGGQALARFVLDRPEIVRGKRILDFATGSGLVAIAASLSGARLVTAVDVDPLACAAVRENARVNGVEIETQATDRVGDPLPEIDVVLAGDVFYEREPSSRFVAWFRALAAAGKTIYAGDPGRAYVPPDLDVVARYDVPTTLDLEGAISRVAVVGRFGPR